MNHPKIPIGIQHIRRRPRAEVRHHLTLSLSLYLSTSLSLSLSLAFTHTSVGWPPHHERGNLDLNLHSQQFYSQLLVKHTSQFVLHSTPKLIYRSFSFLYIFGFLLSFPIIYIQRKVRSENYHIAVTPYYTYMIIKFPIRTQFANSKLKIVFISYRLTNNLRAARRDPAEQQPRKGLTHIAIDSSGCSAWS